jgi:acyl-CoA synthetase (AMP-forming)/AMP-acid ligase II
MINVGGAKVHPIEVERVIRTIPGVSEVRVFAKASTVTGEVVACDIVPDAGEDVESLRRTVGRVCLSHLSSVQRPRLVRIVEHIDLSDAGKTIRRTAG